MKFRFIDISEAVQHLINHHQKNNQCLLTRITVRNEVSINKNIRNTEQNSRHTRIEPDPPVLSEGIRLIHIGALKRPHTKISHQKHLLTKCAERKSEDTALLRAD